MSATPARFLVLDSLRGLSACVIVLHHCWPGGFVTGSLLVRNAHPLVDFFFVLSGFVISASYGRRLSQGFSIRTYMLLRLGRIYPMHLAVLAGFLTVAASLAALGSGAAGDFLTRAGLSDLARTALFLQVFTAHGFGIWNAPGWTIAAEFWVYLLSASALRATGGRHIWLLPAILVMLALYLVQSPRPLTEGLPGHAVLRCAYGFGFGALAFWGYAKWGRSLPLNGAASSVLELMLAAACLILVAAAGDSRPAILGPPLFMGAVILFARQGGSLSRFLSVPPLVRLGTLSYSIYMIHALLILLISLLTERLALLPGGPLGTDLLALATLALVIVGAHFCYRWIERPARDASRKYAARFSAARAEAAAPTF